MRAMLCMREHVEAVYRIIAETLASCRERFYPDFAGLLETVFSDRTPSLESPAWLMLPVFACEALEGDPEQAYHVAAALEIGRIAAGCLDEWQDQDTDDALWQSAGPAQTVNLATAMIGLSQLSLIRLTDLGTEPAMILSLQKEFSLTLLHMCAGQHADLNDEVSLDTYETVAGAKSGSLLRLGCRAGAMIAGASADAVTCYGDYGHSLGILAQAWNDLHGLAGVGGKKDIGRSSTLPILAALALDRTQYQPHSSEGKAGQLFALTQLQTLHRRAVEALARCPAPGSLTVFLDMYSPNQLFERKSLEIRPSCEDDLGR